VPTSLDLHGLTVDEARNRVAGYISRAILAGHERVEIVHGIGSGRLREMVAKDLASIAVVRAVKPHPSNPGVTLVYL
jgi:DNA mismatch repair protein MutS2